jgi:hypothetical protein
MGPAITHAQHRFLAGCNDRVAADDQIGGRHADTGGPDVALVGPDQDMAPGGAAFLRQSAGVLRHDALAFDMCCHAQQLADRDHAGPSDARHDDAPHGAVVRLR